MTIELKDANADEHYLLYSSKRINYGTDVENIPPQNNQLIQSDNNCDDPFNILTDQVKTLKNVKRELLLNCISYLERLKAMCEKYYFQPADVKITTSKELNQIDMLNCYKQSVSDDYFETALINNEALKILSITQQKYKRFLQVLFGSISRSCVSGCITFEDFQLTLTQVFKLFSY